MYRPGDIKSESIHVYAYTYKHTYTHTHTYAHTYTYTCTCIYTRTRYISHMHTHTHTCVCVHPCQYTTLLMHLSAQRHDRAYCMYEGTSNEGMVMFAITRPAWLCEVHIAQARAFAWFSKWMPQTVLASMLLREHVTMHCAHAWGSRFTTLTLCVPEQGSLQQPDHHCVWGRVPGPHVASMAVSSGMWLTA